MMLVTAARLTLILAMGSRIILASISPAQWALVVPCCAATLYIMFAALVRYGPGPARQYR
ncbi:hypothetical protein [Caballeronia sp. DA-9]|uniref:hypothetical protein n=1 Tax=Caballeronia sp. DA-9 TaxID=3436237 RepID=UPI003F667EAE